MYVHYQKEVLVEINYKKGKNQNVSPPIIVNKEEENPIIKVLQLQIRGKYLPNILVKMGFFDNNAEARKYIKNSSIIIDKEIITDIDYEIIKGKVYNIEKDNIIYEVTII